MMKRLLILVVALMATMAVAAPSLVRARDVYVLNAAAHDVATTLYGARIQAITRNQDCRLRVASTTSYVVECEDGAWALVTQTELPRGLTVTANARPEFHRRGNVSPAGTVSGWDPTGRVRRVVVNVNGRVRIQ